MKNILIILVIIVISSCERDSNSSIGNPIEELPPATQTGERTFGCLVNGQAFVHNDGVMNCFYQLIDGEFYFGIQGKDGEKNPSSVSLGTNKKEILQGMTYQLVEESEGNATGAAFFRTSTTDGEGATTNSIFTGELTITKLDFTTNIVSGTFWFDVQHPITGETVEIREGRFDSHFTQ